MRQNQSPEQWMCGTPEAVKVQKEADKESIRHWYDRTTKQWRKGLVWATVGAVVAASVLYGLASFPFLARLQTFNGAITIPIAALIWMLIFTFVFLVPSREASFRSQEWIEAMVGLVEQAVREQLAPAAVVWRKIGERVEHDMPGFVREIREAVDTIKTSAANLDLAIQKNDKVTEEALPVVKALRRIEERIEREGLIDEMHDAARAIKSFAGAPLRRSEEPSIEKALAALHGGRK